jgi:molybdopterin/thiamine biosynthesis adenylyltransferase
MNDLPIVVVGAGALGSEVCSLLAQQKFTQVLIVDPDRLEERNIPCSSIYQHVARRKGIKALNEFKVNLLLDEIHYCFGNRWNALAKEIADVDLRLFAHTQLILSCTDSALARIETTRVARVLGISVLDGGVIGNGIAEGRVTWFATNQQEACYLCGIAEKRRAEILSYAASASLGCRVIEHISPMAGSLSAVKKTAAVMISFIQRWKMTMTSFDHSFAVRLQLNKTKSWSQLHIDLSRSSTCPWHDQEPGTWHYIPEDRPIREAFADEKLTLQLLWPQCVTARCYQCGARSELRQRVTWVRRKAICLACGAQGTCEPIEVIDTLTSTDPRASLTPKQLGLPIQQLYFFRRSFIPMKKDPDEPAP